MSKQDSALMEEIKDVLQQDDISSLDHSQAKNVLKLVKDKKLDQSHVAALITCFPGTVQVLTEALGTIAKASEKAGDEGIETLKSVQKCIDSFNSLANRSDLSEETVRQISRDTRESVNTLKEINKDNKTFWTKVVGIVTLITGGVVITWKILSGKEA